MTKTELPKPTSENPIKVTVTFEGDVQFDERCSGAAVVVYRDTEECSRSSKVGFMGLQESEFLLVMLDIAGRMQEVEGVPVAHRSMAAAFISACLSSELAGHVQ